jgi:hypothetical protein
MPASTSISRTVLPATRPLPWFGIIELHEGLYYHPAIGDAYSMVRGCRKRLSDCQARWNGTATYNNVANFGGFPHVPTVTQYGQIGGQK